MGTAADAVDEDDADDDVESSDELLSINCDRNRFVELKLKHDADEDLVLKRTPFSSIESDMFSCCI